MSSTSTVTDRPLTGLPQSAFPMDDAAFNRPGSEEFMAVIQAKAKMVEDGLAVGRRHKLGTKPAGIVFTGMGGSGLTAALVADACTRVMDTPFTVVRHYNLPAFAAKDWQVLAVSYSGETEETLAVVRQAKARGVAVTGFSSGGSLKAMSGTAFVPQPTGYQPRCAVAHTWASMLTFLEGSGMLAEKVPGAKMVEAVRDVDATCGPQVPEARNPAKQLARHLHGKVPQIYATPSWMGVARFYKALLNENAKKIAHIEELPEGNHNDFTAWGGDKEARKGFAVLAMSHGAQNPELQKRLDFMRERFAAWGVPWLDHTSAPITTFSEHVVEQARALQFYEYAAYYSAMLKGEDPSKIPEVLALKAFLRGQK